MSMKQKRLDIARWKARQAKLGATFSIVPASEVPDEEVQEVKEIIAEVLEEAPVVIEEKKTSSYTTSKKKKSHSDD